MKTNTLKTIPLSSRTLMRPARYEAYLLRLRSGPRVKRGVTFVAILITSVLCTPFTASANISDFLSGYIRPEVQGNRLTSGPFNPGNVFDVREYDSINNLFLRVTPPKSKSPIVAKAESDIVFRPLSQTNELDFIIYQVYAGLNFDDVFLIQIGKQKIPVGTGLAFNPIDKVNQLKDPFDPNEPLQGTPTLKFEYIPSEYFSITGLLMNTLGENLSSPFNLTDDMWAIILYGLVADIDLHLAIFHKALGFAFVRDIDGIVLHSEIVLNRKPALSSFGPNAVVGGALNPANQTAYDQDRVYVQSVIGFHTRLIEDFTITMEYYFNGLAYTPAQTRDFVSSLTALQSNASLTGATALQTQMISSSISLLRRHYVYLNIAYSSPEIFILGLYATILPEAPGVSVGPYFEYIAWQDFNLRFLALANRPLDSNPLNEFSNPLSSYATSFRLTYHF